MKKIAALMMVAVLAGGSMVQAEELKSGLEPGVSVGAFNVRDITGPAKGETLCYRCRYGGRPVVGIFARNVDDKLAEMVRQLDAKVGANEEKQMRAFVVLLTENPDADAKKLEKLAETAKVKNIPLTVFDGQAGPPEYNIAKDAEVNVMMWVGGKVKVNSAFAKGDVTKLEKKDIEGLVKDSDKILE